MFIKGGEVGGMPIKLSSVLPIFRIIPLYILRQLFLTFFDIGYFIGADCLEVSAL